MLYILYTKTASSVTYPWSDICHIYKECSTRWSHFYLKMKARFWECNMYFMFVCIACLSMHVHPLFSDRLMRKIRLRTGVATELWQSSFTWVQLPVLHVNMRMYMYNVYHKFHSHPWPLLFFKNCSHPFYDMIVFLCSSWLVHLHIKFTVVLCCF